MLVARVVRQAGRAVGARSLAVATTSTGAPEWSVSPDKLKSKYDAVIVGGGHNGLVAACYLAKAGKKVCVLERRHVIGGAALTEEIVPGFKFSRASYLLSLFRQSIIDDLELKKFGFKVYMRDPSSFTPQRDGSRYLTLGSDSAANAKEIAKFSQKDSVAYGRYEAMLERLTEKMEPLIDSVPAQLTGSLVSRLSSYVPLGRFAMALGKDIPDMFKIMLAPASQILDQYFESSLLKATLATDAVIGAFVGPDTPGSGYVLFHHVMGNLEGKRGAWGYVEGGMGGLSLALARKAKSLGVDIALNSPVKEIAVSGGHVQGAVLGSGATVSASTVLSNATPDTTFRRLVRQDVPEMDQLRKILLNNDYSSATMKINVAIKGLPNFKALPNRGSSPMPHHQCTIHFEDDMREIQAAYVDALGGKPSERPIIEFCMPSTKDPTIAPEGHHVVNLFIQYTPYKLAKGSWDDAGFKDAYADKIFKLIDEYAPGFSSQVVGRDILSPLDLERTLGLTGGNIFHGSMGLSQLYSLRPNPAMSNYKTPIKGLYMCGAGAHPGGGVMGAAGRNCARVVLS